MFFSLILQNPAIGIAFLAAVLLSLTVHEFSHGMMARIRGDKTAEYAGRLTLNPVSHIDPIGLLAFLFIGFGWARPVPYNPYNLRDPRWDSVKVALAGPGSNLAFALAVAVAVRFLLPGLGIANLLSAFLVFLLYVNVILAFFNLIPVPPLDGSKLLLALLDKPKYFPIRDFIERYGTTILFAAVIASIVLPGVNLFGFIMGPTFAVCDALAGESCFGLLNLIFAAA